MKDPRIVITFVLTLLVWMYFRLRTPPSPLGATETLVVAACVAALVYFAFWVAGKLKEPKKGKAV